MHSILASPYPSQIPICKIIDFMSQNTKFEASNFHGLKDASHNNANLCVMSHCVQMSIYEHNACMMHKCDVKQNVDRIILYYDVPSNVFSQYDFNNYMF